MSACPIASEVVHLEPIDNSEFFLGDVRRGAGVLCTLDEAGKWRQYPFFDPEDALARVEAFKETRDIYVTMGTLREGATQRTAENIVSLCGFFVDLDCHGRDGDYADILEATDALRSFCRATGLPKPDYLVSSGHGLHAHWTFYDPIPREIWQGMANDLKNLMMAHDLKADHQVTADPARVLRVPNTYNFRDRTAPAEVELLPIQRMTDPTTITEFRRSLDDAFCRLPATGKAVTARSPSPLMTLVSGQRPRLPETPANVVLVRDMLECLDPDSDYETWRNAIWGVAATDFASARELARDWSERGEKWDPAQFDNVWNSFDPSRSLTVGFGSLVRQARASGYSGTIPAADTGFVAEQAAPHRRFRLLDRAAIMALPPLTWRVKGILPEVGIGAIYGTTGSGKSFLGFDLGISVALGKSWFGHRVTPGPVTYVMLEGEAGLRNRIDAWEKHNNHPIPANFKAMAQPFELADPEQVKELGEVAPKGGVIFIDTLNRAAPGLDENSSQDMGRVLAGMKRLQELTGSLVLIVHHTGKDASKGLRGHSSLFAALDGAIEVERSATSRCWSAAKVKDGEDGMQVPFKLHVVDLGTDSDGETITSCAVERDAAAVFRKNPPKGQHQKNALAAIRSALGSATDLGQAGAGQQTPCLPLEEAVMIAADALVGLEKKRRTQRAREAMQGLVNGGHLKRGLDGEQEEWVWL